MRKIILCFVIFVFSKGLFGADLYAYDVNNCQTWTSNSSGTGFVCASWPSSVRVAEAASFAKEIRNLEAKIAELEDRIKKLEGHQRE